MLTCYISDNGFLRVKNYFFCATLPIVHLCNLKNQTTPYLTQIAYVFNILIFMYFAQLVHHQEYGE